MFLKRFNYVLLALFLVLLLCVACVSASDGLDDDVRDIPNNASDDVLSVNNSFSDNSNNPISDSLVNEANNVSISENLEGNSTKGSKTIEMNINMVNNNTIFVNADKFEYVQYAIDIAEENSTIILDTINHTNCYGNGTPIIVNKSVTITSNNGITLDANYSSRIFCVLADNVILKNMILINGNHSFLDDGLIMYPYVTPRNSDELSQGAGAAIKWVGNNGSLINSAFYYNHYDASTSYNGKVISWLGENGTLSNTHFLFNSFTFYPTMFMIDSFWPVDSKVIDNTIHGEYKGSLYWNLNIVDAKVNTLPDLKNNSYSSYYGSLDKISFNLSEDTKFNNETLLINITGKDYNYSFNVSSDSNGLVSFDLPKNLTVGTYNLSVLYSCDGVNKSSNSVLKVVKVPVKVSVSNYSTYYASSKKYNVKLTNSKNSKLVSNVTVYLRVYNGSKYKVLSAKTNSKGIASFDLSKFNVGKHKVVISGDKNVVLTKKTVNISISKASTVVKFNKNSFKFKKSDYLRINIINKNTKKALANVSVKVKVYTGKTFKTYNLKTDKNGIVKINTKSLKKGSHSVVLSSGGNYLISKKTSIKIK